MNTFRDKPKVRGMRLVLALAAISLTIGSCYLFAASGCAQNAAGQTIESADFETVAIWTFMLAQCPATAWVVTRPGASAWRSALHGVLLNVVGLMLMFLLAMVFSSVFDPSSRLCIDTVSARP